MKGSFGKKLGILCLALMMVCRMYADKDIIVDHDNQTITIAADFVTYDPIEKTMKAAVAVWNAQSGRYNFEVEVDGKALLYTVNFCLTVNQQIEQEPINTVSIIPENARFNYKKIWKNHDNCELSDQTAGLSDGRTIVINAAFTDDIYVMAHEMGHNLGISHSIGLMDPHLAGKYIPARSIRDALSPLTRLCYSIHNQSKEDIFSAGNVKKNNRRNIVVVHSSLD